jgi:alkanesulfonate monooxygenase SsuD/methylene tetrahydromethanopterin reductase-like flavin-dependent oxidoreductase (luciferase family)
MTATETVGAARRRLGWVGVWLMDVFTSGATPADVEREQAARIEALGYGSLWIAEGLGGKEAFAHLGILLAATERLVIGAGIANLRARGAAAMHGGAVTLAEAYPGRFVLGVGGATVADRMREYLDAMDAAAAGPVAPRFAASRDGASYVERVRRYLEGTSLGAAGAPPVRFPRVLAALGPRMLGVARERADGAHPFGAPVEHTAVAREALGPDRLLVPEQAVVLDTDAGRARATARDYVAMGRRMPTSPYSANLRRLGYGDEDLLGDGSDRLVDALVAWGGEDAIVSRVRRQLEAGADHVLVHPLAPDLPSAVDQLERLAPALLEPGCVGAPDR